MEKNIEQILADLLKDDKIKALLALPESAFNIAFERLRRAHLERLGYKFQDPFTPGCESCEG